jgi:hypothetical protein
MSSKWAETSGEWVHRPCKEAEADGYIVWEREAANGTIYKVTLGTNPPAPSTGGFYKLSTAMLFAMMEVRGD